MKAFKKIISFLFAIIIPFSLISCGENSKGNSSQSIEVKPNTDKPTENLTVYCHAGLNYFMEPALTIYKKLYPNVNIIIKDSGDVNNPNDTNEYYDRVRTEIAAGKGPDLLVCMGSFEFNDIFKTMESGAFYDLNSLLASDKDFDTDNYVKSVFDSGVYKNKRYFIPINYSTASIITTEENLESAQINKERLNNFKEFSEQVKRYVKKNLNNNKTVFYNQKQQLTVYFPWCGLKYINYPNKEVNVDTQEFKIVMEAYKDLYKQDWVLGKSRGGSSTGDEVVALRNKSYLFDTLEYSTLEGFSLDYGALLHDQKPILLRFPNFDGKTVAQPNCFVGVLNSSENKVNAYNFIKVLLSEEMQMSSTLLGIPILKSTISKKLNYIIENEIGGTPDGNIIVEKIPQETVKEFLNDITNIDKCEIVSYGSIDIIFKEMEPYFKDEVSYKKCLKNTKEKLEIYISE